jgi:DNA-binding MarR family transcriptional regulator
MIQSFFGLTARMTGLRERIGAIAGLSGAQYSMLVSLGHLTRNGERVSVNTLAEHLHVSGTYVTAESKGLEKLRLLRRDPNPDDRRSVLLSLDEPGRLLLDDLLPSVRVVNDALFADLNSKSFAVFCAELPNLVKRADEALLVARAQEIRHRRVRD